MPVPAFTVPGLRGPTLGAGKPVFSSSVIICCQGPAVDTGQQEPSELVKGFLHKVWLFKEAGGPVAGEDACCGEPLWQHVVVFEPIDDGLYTRPRLLVDAGLLMLPYPRVRRVCVQAMDSDEVEVGSGLVLGIGVDVAETNTSLN